MADKNEKLYQMSFAKIYPLLINKAIRKGRTEEEVQIVIEWLTGYKKDDIRVAVNKNIAYRQFFEQAPRLNPNRKLIKGIVCGVRVEEISEPIMQEIRYLDKLIDELAKGKTIEKILRASE